MTARRHVTIWALVTTLLTLLHPTPARAATPDTAARVSLNGDQWQFKAVKMPYFGWETQAYIRDAIDAVPATEWSTWHDVRVPMAWNSVGEFDFPSYWHYIHKGEYKRTFTVPASFAGRRVKLHFEGVNWQTSITVNGTLAGTHEFALTPFDVDITDLVTPGSTNNTLDIVVQDITANFIGPAPNEYSVVKYPMGVRGEYWPQSNGAAPRLYHEAKSGLFKDVELVGEPDVSVEDVFVRPNPAAGTITAEVTVHNATATAQSVVVANQVDRWSDGAAALTFADSAARTVPAGQSVKVSVTQPWTTFQLWWPDDPVLYNLVTTLKVGADRIQHTERFGVRDVKAVSDGDPDVRGVYVNGVRTALFGESIETNLHGAGVAGIEADGLTFNGNWALTRSYFSQVIDVAKAMNINVLRIHRGWALNRDIVDVADEKGMMLIAENPVTHPSWEVPLAAAQRETGLEAVLGIARHYRNHPSIVMWSISNENPAYNTELTAGMKTGYGGEDAVNPDIQLVSADAETAEVKSDGYLGGYLNNPTPKTWFTYEENASYLKLGDAARRASVIDSMRIFRQQRMSLGYDAKVMLAFYNFQKVFSLPPDTYAVPWSAADVAGPGYHAKYLWHSIMNPYTSPPTTTAMRDAQELWQDTYAPVAVFDKAWVDAAMTGPGLSTPYSTGRTFFVFNSDLRDRSTAVTVGWSLVDADSGAVIRSGSSVQSVPLGGSASVTVDTGTTATQNVLLRLTAAKSGTVRFDETLAFGGAVPPPPPTQSVPGGDVVVLDNGEAGTATSGLTRSTAYTGTYGLDAAAKTAPQAGDLARFTPYLGTSGQYDIWMHVPGGLSGTQKVNVVRDDGGLVQSSAMVDTAAAGWVKVPGGPYRMSAGQAANFLELVPGGTAPALVADGVAFQRVTGGATTLKVDESRAPGHGATWQYLGTYTCGGGTSCSVRLSNAANGRVVADAVQFRRGGSTVTVDEDQAARTGAWTSAAKPASVGGDVLYADPGAAATITYSPALPSAGAWDAYLTWDDNAGNQRATDLPVTVASAAGWDVFDDGMDTPASWTGVGGGGATTWTGSAARVVDSSTTDYYAIARAGTTPPTGAFTYEFVAHTNAAGSAEVAVRSGSYYIRVVLNHGTAGSATDGYGSAAKSFTLDTTAEHTYRVVVHASYAYDLYVDGVLRWSGAASKGSGTNIVKIGSEPATRADLTVDRVSMGTGERLP
ncbi:sugar-binding domain-containing protein [Dactylosporangium sp. NPDC000244]|uniref:golvesin C-terminal-like domain-containing protein n=1 Tax=Dactylosporangium sp. NPDC000244 TaxID=3154365 RepID=UPI003330EE60